MYLLKGHNSLLLTDSHPKPNGNIMETKAVNLLPLIQIVHTCIIPSYFIVTRSNQYILQENVKILKGYTEDIH